MKENQICYFIENDMVIFGAYSYKSTSIRETCKYYCALSLKSF